MGEGYRRRQHRDLERFAVLASWIINGSGWRKKAIKVSDLIKPDPNTTKTEKLTGDEIREMIDGMAREYKKKFWTKFNDKYAPKNKG